MAIEREIGQGSRNSTTISEEVRKIRSEAMKKRWQDSIARESRIQSISQAIKGKWQEAEYRKKSSSASSRKMKKKWQDPEYRARLSKVHKLKWQNPEYRARRITVGINQINRGIWEAARDQNIIPQILELGLIEKEELLTLEKGFSTKRPKKIISDELMDKFSVAVAKVA